MFLPALCASWLDHGADLLLMRDICIMQAQAAELSEPLFFDPKQKAWVNLDRRVNDDVDLFAPAGAINSNVSGAFCCLCRRCFASAAGLLCTCWMLISRCDWCSQLEDMQKWLAFQLRRGVGPNGDTLLSTKRWRDMTSSSMVGPCLPLF